MNSNFKKNILITGINGFIGSHCARHFASKYRVYGIGLGESEYPNSINGTLTQDNLEKFTAKFDIVVHLAGTGTVGAADKHPEKEYVSTVSSTDILINYILAKHANAKLIYISSAAVYGDKTGVISEQDKLSPISTYGKHKLEAEKLCLHRAKDGLNFSILRLFSVYGEGLKKQLLWDFSKRIKDNFNQSSIKCYGSGLELRDYIHIYDVVRLIDTVIKQSVTGSIINGGTGNGTNVSTVLNLLVQQYHYDGKLIYDNIERKGNPKELVANINEATGLGFIPSVNILDGIVKYANWFKKEN